MNNTAIRVEGLGKVYRLGQAQRHNTLRDALVEGLRAPLGWFRRNGTTPDSAAEATVWALKDVSFEIKRGEVIGIIGRNGAGKSTLLKILSRITEPTDGVAAVQGRVGSLLEVGTGFHPELTGRENIYLNGAILGMRRAEIRRKFDEIVAFAEVERFLDTPVKRYSSGMYVRLAFAVAAHLEPEILVIDEVLAVGDVAFQKKCMGRMGEVAEGGRTVLFVSHNMNAIQRLCPRCIMLDHGRLAAYDDTPKVIVRYLTDGSGTTQPAHWIDLADMGRRGTGRVRFAAIQYRSDNEAVAFRPYSSGPLDVLLVLDAASPMEIGSIAVTLYDEYGTKLVNADTISLGRVVSLSAGRNIVQVRIRKLHLNPGTYMLGLWVANPPAEIFDWADSVIKFEVIRLEAEGFGVRPLSDGLVACDFDVDKIT